MIKESTRTDGGQVKLRCPCFVGTAMAAEVAGVCVCAFGILDRVVNECMCVHHVNRCIDRILDMKSVLCTCKIKGKLCTSQKEGESVARCRAHPKNGLTCFATEIFWKLQEFFLAASSEEKAHVLVLQLDSRIQRGAWVLVPLCHASACLTLGRRLSPKARDKHVLAGHLGAVLGTRTRALAPMNSVDWRSKKGHFDVLTCAWPNTVSSDRAIYTREYVLTEFW